MELSQISLFQLFTLVQSTLQIYLQGQSNIDQILSLSNKLQKIQLSPQIIFQQLIPASDQFISLKLTLLKQTFDSLPTNQPSDFKIQNLEQINSKEDLVANMQSGSEIIRKLSAIKSEIIFMNQELSIQPLEQNINPEMRLYLKSFSLRKLIKQHIRKTINKPLQSLTSICIRLVVIQESIMVELSKIITYFSCVLNESDEVQANVMHMETSVSSVSSLSASIQRFLQRKTQSIQDEGAIKDILVKEYGMHQPRIKSNYLFERIDKQICLDEVYDIRKGNKCCLWF